MYSWENINIAAHLSIWQMVYSEASYCMVHSIYTFLIYMRLTLWPLCHEHNALPSVTQKSFKGMLIVLLGCSVVCKKWWMCGTEERVVLLGERVGLERLPLIWELWLGLKGDVYSDVCILNQPLKCSSFELYSFELSYPESNFLYTIG